GARAGRRRARRVAPARRPHGPVGGRLPAGDRRAPRRPRARPGGELRDGDAGVQAARAAAQGARPDRVVAYWLSLVPSRRGGAPPTALLGRQDERERATGVVSDPYATPNRPTRNRCIDAHSLNARVAGALNDEDPAGGRVFEISREA